MVESSEFPKAPEPKTKPQRVGMLLEKLDDDLFEKVVGIYDKVFGSDASKYLYPGYVKNVYEGLARSNVAEFRFGSKFSLDSKLEVVRGFRLGPDMVKTVIYFDFYLNAPIHPKRKLEEERLESLFRNRIDHLLTNKGLAIPLER